MFHSMYSFYNPKTTLYSAGYNVKDSKVTDLAVKVLKKKGIELIKKVPNRLEDYIDLDFDNIIILDKEFDIKTTQLKTLKTSINLIEDPYGEDLITYENTLSEIDKVLKEFYIN